MPYKSNMKAARVVGADFGSWDCHGGVPPLAGFLGAWTENGVPYRSSGAAAQ